MSIIIEDTTDIELLIEFCERFNLYETKEKLGSVEKTYEEICEKIADEEYVHREEIATIVENQIQSAIPKIVEMVIDELQSSKKPQTIRKYKKEHPKFLITGINKDGTFNQQKGKPLSFTILDVLRLQKAIPNFKEYPTFQDLSEEFEIGIKTMIRLCYLIETGAMNKWIEEWEQMEADNFYGKYGNWKPNFENNPQKRKEQGMV